MKNLGEKAKDFGEKLSAIFMDVVTFPYNIGYEAGKEFGLSEAHSGALGAATAIGFVAMGMSTGGLIAPATVFASTFLMATTFNSVYGEFSCMPNTKKAFAKPNTPAV